MSEYHVEPFNLVNCSEYTYYKLYINGKCQFDDFIGRISNNAVDLSKLKSIVAMMESFGSSKMLPKTKFNSIKDAKRSDLFEFKKDDIRVYVVKQRPDMFIVMGGYKKNQKKDIEKLKIKLKQINLISHGKK